MGFEVDTEVFGRKLKEDASGAVQKTCGRLTVYLHSSVPQAMKRAGLLDMVATLAPFVPGWLRDLHIKYEALLSGGEAITCVEVMDDYTVARLWVSDCWGVATEEDQFSAIVHELLHVHFRPGVARMERAMTALSYDEGAATLAVAEFARQHESEVSELTACLTPLLRSFWPFKEER